MRGDAARTWNGWWSGVVAGIAVTLAGATAAHAQTHLASRWEVETRGQLPQATAVDPRQPGRLFAALKTGGVGIFESGVPTAPPALVATIRTADLASLDAMNLVLRDQILYVALGDFFNNNGSKAGLAAIDITDPEHPVVRDVWVTDTVVKGASSVVVDGRYAFLGAMTHGVLVLDVLDTDDIRFVTAIVPDANFPKKNPSAVQHPNVRGVAVQGNRLYVAYDAGGLRIMDISTLTAPRELGRYVNSRMGSKQQAFNSVIVDGDRAYVAVDYAGLEILDVRNPGSIRQLGWWNPWRAELLSNIWFNSAGHTNQIGYDAVRRLVYLSAGDSELQVVNVSDPFRPRLVADYGATRNNRGAWGMTLADDAVYLTYIQAVVPFQSSWSGLVSVERMR
jgi:hypothetical protein